MTMSVSKCKTFFAKSVTYGTQDTLTVVGFADDKLESTQFVTIYARKPKSATKKQSYVVQVDSDENESRDAIEAFQLKPGMFEATFTKQSASELGFSSVKIEFEPLSDARLAQLRETLDALI